MTKPLKKVKIPRSANFFHEEENILVALEIIPLHLELPSNSDSIANCFFVDEIGTVQNVSAESIEAHAAKHNLRKLPEKFRGTEKDVYTGIENDDDIVHRLLANRPIPVQKYTCISA